MTPKINKYWKLPARTIGCLDNQSSLQLHVHVLVGLRFKEMCIVFSDTVTTKLPRNPQVSLSFCNSHSLPLWVFTVIIENKISHSLSQECLDRPLIGCQWEHYSLLTHRQKSMVGKLCKEIMLALLYVQPGVILNGICSNIRGNDLNLCLV